MKAHDPSRRDMLKDGAAGLAGIGIASTLSIVSGPRLAFAQAPRPKVIVLKGTGNVALLESLLLKELKLFEKYDVDADVVSMPDSNKILAALASGDGDICAGFGLSSLFPAIEKGATIKILAGANSAPNTILYSARPEITSLKNLPGHTVGVGAPGALLHQLVAADMMKYGVDYMSVNFVNVGSGADIFKALVGGSIDAGVAPVEFRNSAARYKLTPLVDGEFYKELPLYVSQAMYATDRAIAEKRQGLVRVMAAFAELFRWMSNNANKQAFIRSYRQVVSDASEEEAAFLQDFTARPRRLATNLVLSGEQLRYIQELNVELGSQKVQLAFDRCADMSLAREAVKLIKA